MLNASQNKCIVELLTLFNGKNSVIVFVLFFWKGFLDWTIFLDWKPRDNFNVP